MYVYIYIEREREKYICGLPKQKLAERHFGQSVRKYNLSIAHFLESPHVPAIFFSQHLVNLKEHKNKTNNWP